MLFFFKKGKKKKHKNRGTRSSYKTSKKESLGYIQRLMITDSIINKKRLLVYAD